MRTNSGFSLVEVLISIAVVGVAISAIVVVLVNSTKETSSFNQRYYAQEVASTYRLGVRQFAARLLAGDCADLKKIVKESEKSFDLKGIYKFEFNDGGATSITTPGGKAAIPGACKSGFKKSNESIYFCGLYKPLNNPTDARKTPELVVESLIELKSGDKANPASCADFKNAAVRSLRSTYKIHYFTSATDLKSISSINGQFDLDFL